SEVAAELLRNPQQPGTASGVGVLAREAEVRRSGNLRRALARVLEIARRPIALHCEKGAAIPHGHRRVGREALGAERTDARLRSACPGPPRRPPQQLAPAAER